MSAALLTGASAVMSNCRQSEIKPVIEFTRIPPAAPGGLKVDRIEGRVTGARGGQRIVLLALSGYWWLQGRPGQPYTTVQSDSTWKSPTHLGSEYAALLVEPGYVPQNTLHVLPQPGAGVVAVARVVGDKASQFVPDKVHFSGYDWESRQVPSDRGTINDYDPANAWTDANGWLHLRIVRTEGGWKCAELKLPHSLGYGSYRFVVRNVSHLESAVVFGMFTWDDSNADQNHREIDIEITRWADPSNKNNQYIIQPYYVAANIFQFMTPQNRLTYSFRWQPGRIAFKTIRETAAATLSGVVAENVFTSGVPVPAEESVHLILYVDGRAKVSPNMKPPKSLLRSLNTCHKSSVCRHSCIALTLLCLLTAGFVQPASAIDPNRAMSQYLRDRWGAENGFPRGPVYAITQTKDGYLWIGTQQGLVRFDGLNFQLVDGMKSPVFDLAPDVDGSLWVRVAPPTLFQYRDGEFRTVTKDIDGMEHTVTTMCRSSGGSVVFWILEGDGGVVERRGQKFETLATQTRLNDVLSMTQMRNGDIWTGTRAGLFRLTHGETLAVTKGLPRQEGQLSSR